MGEILFAPLRPFGVSSGSGGGDPRVGERLRADRMVFRYPDGAIHRVKRVFGSRLGQRWMRGERAACEAFVQSQLEDGANSVRVFCQYHRGIALTDADIFRPTDSTPAQWRDFARWLASFNLRASFTTLADCPQFGMGHQAQVDRVRRLVDAVAAEPNVSIEISNEWTKNSDDPGQIAIELGYTVSRPCLMMTGDYSLSKGMVVLDAIGDHASRKIDWASEAAKAGHFMTDGWTPDANSPDGWRGSGCPSLEDETVGLKEGPPDFDGRRESRPEAVEDGYAGYAVGMAGADVFSDAHHQANVPGPGVRSLTQLAFATMDDIPVEMPTGQYVHDGNADHPLDSTAGRTSDEVAGRILGPRAVLVAANPRPAYRAVARNGWRIVKTNARGNIVHLERP